jgi:hypothetical protein
VGPSEIAVFNYLPLIVGIIKSTDNKKQNPKRPNSWNIDKIRRPENCLIRT